MTAKKQTFSAIPLGGLGEVGRNMMVYECNNDIVLVDCGVSFADAYEPGIDLVIPDTRYLRENLKKIKALAITHAHEDHIGAVSYLWDELNDCKVYVSPFARKVLENKLQQVGIAAKEAAGRIVTIEAGEQYTVGCMKLEYIEVTHSILEAFALALHTPLGTVLHTGDYKFDHSPVVGHSTNEKRLKSLGQSGNVLAMFGDSTNIFNMRAAGSESEILKHIDELMKSTKNKVFFSAFASNTGRLIKATEIAIQNGRKVCYLGRTANNMVSYAKDLGYFPNGLAQHIVDAEEAAKLPKNKIMIFSSGTQGESNASLTRLSHGNSVRGISIESGDVILMSSKMIPGNERPILDVHNRLVALGAVVIAEDHDLNIHVSGHGGRPEIEKMYQLVKPRYAVPVHGEYAMLNEHAQVALKQGVENSFVLINGHKVVFSSDDAPKVIRSGIPSGKNYIDGYNILENNSPILKDRRKLSFDGVISASLVISAESKQILGPIALSSKGILDEAVQKDLLDMSAEAAMDGLGNLFSDDRIDDIDRAKDAIRSVIRKTISKYRGKKPTIICQVIEV